MGAKKKKGSTSSQEKEQLSLFPPSVFSDAPYTGTPYLDRFPDEVEKVILLQLIEEDAERWVAEIEWNTSTDETPEEFFGKMGF